MTLARPVMILAGGTGGHVFPALAVADCLRAMGVPVVWLGTRAGLESRVVPAKGIPVEWIAVRGLRGKGLRSWLSAPFMVLRALWQALAAVRRHRPRAALGMGGYVAGPGALAARLAGCPLLIHEQNARAGLTNRLLSRLASKVLVGFPGVLIGRGAVFTGNPVRSAIAQLAPPDERFAGRSDGPRLLVIGGSQGAKVLNEVMAGAIARLEPAIRPVIHHQAGQSTLELARAAYAAAQVKAEVMPFIDDMAEAYGWADLVVSRAGALTIAELAAVGVAAVLVPLPYAVDDHQTANAAYLCEAGAAVLLPQRELSEARLAAILTELLGNRRRLIDMAAKSRRLGRADAAERVARFCLEVSA